MPIREIMYILSYLYGSFVEVAFVLFASGDVCDELVLALVRFLLKYNDVNIPTSRRNQRPTL
ncbi:hypothetical protein BDZ94DRAFT_1262214 [Collybia nuda]|uniref:Uncharacterized protein n=1 Tax=Collybia nuda TaxID=64659 RepID=A0A9P5Y5J3_9AGAR|nr:hypothetical protein BDZ94DRAFT_1262214 [Collybia nuda]